EVDHVRKKGYPAEFSVGLSGVSALISPIMPPSIPAVIYGSVAAVSIGALFAAAVLPALIMSAAMIAMVWWWSRKNPGFEGEPYNWPVVRRAVWRALPAMGAPVLILGGILGGWFTPTEAAAVGAVYMLAIALSYRSLKLKDIALIFRDTAAISGQIMLIIGASALLSWILSRERVPEMFANAILEFTDDKWVFLLLVNVMLIVLGMVLEPSSAIIILVPILLPVAIEFGVDPVHFGSLIVFNLMLALLTPPMGGVVFVLSSVTRIPIERVFRGVAYFLPAMVLVLLLITYVPAVTTWLPGLFKLGSGSPGHVRPAEGKRPDRLPRQGRRAADSGRGPGRPGHAEVVHPPPAHRAGRSRHSPPHPGRSVRPGPPSPLLG